MGAIPKGLLLKNKAPARHFFENLWGAEGGGAPLKRYDFGLQGKPWETLDSVMKVLMEYPKCVKNERSISGGGLLMHNVFFDLVTLTNAVKHIVLS